MSLKYSLVNDHISIPNIFFYFSLPTGVPPKYHCVRNCGYKTHIHSNLKRHLNSKFCKPPSPEGAPPKSDETQANDENI